MNDKIIISKEEFEEYQKFKSFMERNDWTSVEDMENTLDKCQEVLYERLQQANRKTAEKVINWFRENSVCIPSVEYINEFAKQFGVEIKE